MREKEKIADWESYVSKLAHFLAEEEKKYDMRLESEVLQDTKDNHVRATRFTVDAIAYIKVLCQAFVQDFVGDAMEIAKAEKKKTINFHDHLLPIISPEPAHESTKKALMTRKIHEAAKKWECLSAVLQPQDTETTELRRMNVEEDHCV